jgi:5-methylcytosine-specific restriction endonuclease McrA
VAALLQAGRSRAEIAQELGICKSTVSYHVRRLGGRIDARAVARYDWPAIQRYHDRGHSLSQCIDRFGFSKQAWHAAKKRGVLTTPPRALPIEQLLAAPRTRDRLERHLLKAGLLPDHCQSCGISQWQDRPLSLDLHHVNGNGEDDRLANLELLCPNCHRQTDSWGERNRRPALRLIHGNLERRPGEGPRPDRRVRALRALTTTSPVGDDAA